MTQFKDLHPMETSGLRAECHRQGRLETFWKTNTLLALDFSQDLVQLCCLKEKCLSDIDKVSYDKALSYYAFIADLKCSDMWGSRAPGKFPNTVRPDPVHHTDP